MFTGGYIVFKHGGQSYTCRDLIERAGWASVHTVLYLVVVTCVILLQTIWRLFTHFWFDILAWLPIGIPLAYSVASLNETQSFVRESTSHESEDESDLFGLPSAEVDFEYRAITNPEPKKKKANYWGQDRNL